MQPKINRKTGKILNRSILGDEQIFLKGKDIFFKKHGIKT
jgi:hypothetical protein